MKKVLKEWRYIFFERFLYKNNQYYVKSMYNSIANVL